MSASKVSPLSAEASILPLSLDHPSHTVQFYREDRPLIDGLTRLIGTSLVGGDAVIIVATKSHRDALTRELTARDLNMARAAAEGRYVSLDAAETLSRIIVGGMPDNERFRKVLGHAIESATRSSKVDEPRIVIFGEMVALLWAEQKYDAAIRLEELWNRLAETYTFSLCCAYPMSGFHQDTHREPFARICAEHSTVLPMGGHGILLSDDEQLRTIAKLEQKLEALQFEKALRESEQRFRLLVEAVRDYAIFMLDPEGRITSWNLGAQRLKGYEASEIIGQHFSRFYPEEDVRAAKPQRELEIALKDGRVEDEGWRVHKDGRKFWANVVITALKDRDGRHIGFCKVTRDFTERMQAERALQESKRKLQESETSLRNLSIHLLRTQDEERRRIGRDLHDSLGQSLSVLKMKLDVLMSAASQKQATELAELTQCAQLSEDAVKEVRTISYLLYPPMLEELGLRSAIPWYLEGFAKRSGIKTSFDVSPGLERLRQEVELTFFRVLQESLTNVHRHSGSPTARVKLSIDASTVVLEISDQGKGAELKSPGDTCQDWMNSHGVGVRGMAERVRQIGGKLELSSSDKGTTVTASVPINKAYVAPGDVSN